MLVSIVMAAWNAEAYIGEAITSAVAQTHAEWELLVVDDGSTDATATLAEAFGDDRIRVLRCPHVGVLAQVRNRGLGEARGEAIAFLDSDDVWLETKLACQVAVLEVRPEVGVVHTAAAALVDGVRQELPRAPGGPFFPSLLENNFVHCSSVLLRRSLLETWGSFDPIPALGGAPDYELWLRLAPRTEFAYVDEVLVLYRVHGGQMSAASHAMGVGGVIALERAAARDPELVARARPSYLVGRGRQHMLAGERAAALRCFAAAVALRPSYRSGWVCLLRALTRFVLRVPSPG